MRKASFILLSGAMILVMAFGSALASGGSAYVTSSCDYDKSLQDNTIDQDDNLLVWVKQTGKGYGELTWSAVNNPDGDTDDGTLTVQECTTFGSKYLLYLADGSNDLSLGSWTLTVWDGSASLSGDGFRVVEVLN